MSTLEEMVAGVPAGPQGFMKQQGFPSSLGYHWLTTDLADKTPPPAPPSISINKATTSCSGWLTHTTLGKRQYLQAFWEVHFIEETEAQAGGPWIWNPCLSDFKVHALVNPLFSPLWLDL